jgi:tetratricopeptide repeat protein 30
VLQLQSAINYGNEEYGAAQSVLLQRPTDHPATLNDEGCLMFQANMFDDAIQRYQNALEAGGFSPQIAYNLALCHYRKKENAQALNYIAEIVERGIRNHPELGIGAQTETEGGARSVGNPPSLAMSGLVQAFNLKAAIEYQEGNSE